MKVRATISKEQRIQALRRVARGNWQRNIAISLLRNEEVENPIRFLQGSAKDYTARYTNSFLTLISRIERLGYKVVRKPGKFGGEWSATYRIEGN